MNNFAVDIRRFVSDNFLFGQPCDVEEDASFQAKGIIDSTGVLELVAHLESAYGIKVKDEELVPQNLDSIRAIVTFLECKMIHKR